MAYTTINKSTEHFNTKLYSGNGSTNNITGVGFQPDWLWIKSRGATENHVLYDSVRGVTKQLYSNTSGAESTNATALTAFASDGFNLATTNTNTNANGANFVSWNWKAGGTAPAITYTVKVVSDSGNKYRFDDFGTSAVTLDLQEGGTYTFDQSDSSNAGHPLRFSTTSNGTHGGGSEYTTGVTTTGTPGSSGAKTVQVRQLYIIIVHNTLVWVVKQIQTHYLVLLILLVAYKQLYQQIKLQDLVLLDIQEQEAMLLLVMV